MIHKSILEAIGGTPLVELQRVGKETGCRILVKPEYMNPGGSVKSRTAYWMVKCARERGTIQPDSILVEATSGNQGIGLAMVGAAFGLKVRIVMPENMSCERRQLITAYGAEVVLTPADILHFPYLFGTISAPIILPKETSPMSAIALVTDSTANLPEELLQLYNVTVVPLYVRFGDTVQKDYVELPPAQFYKRLAEMKAAGGELPKTSQPTPADFEACYRAIARDGAKEILSVHVAAKMSGTLNSAQIAGEMISELVSVRVVDSATIAMQMSYMLIEAAEAIRRGGSIQDAVDAAERVKANSCTYFTVTQVEHIEASGRVAGADKVAEAEIAVRPVIGIFDGQAKVVSAERTQRAATEKVVELTRQRLKGLTIKGVSVVHTNAPDRAEALKAAVPAELGYHGQVYVAEMGPVLAVHVGPGVVGLAAYGE